MKICGLDYKMLRVDAGPDEIKFYGRHDPDNLTIKIAVNGVNKQVQMTTIIHEIVEAINWRFGMAMKEQDILSIEMGMYGALSSAGVDLSPLMKEIQDGH